MTTVLTNVPATKVAQTKIGGYRIFEKLGKGAAGTVYKGQDPSTGDIVAVKLLASELVNNEWRMRFAQECQLARMLHHPHIVRVLDFGLDGSKAYLVMEYVDGVSLGQRLEDGGPLPEKEAVALIRQVGQALQWAHERKLVHRDVKPDNILVDAAGQAKLTDLGLAKNLESNLNLTRTNCALGTPQFMAPEQFADAKRADALSDLYSLAATLYMLVTGHLPFEGRGGLMDVYNKKKLNDIAAPRQLVPGLSEPLSKAILRGLRADRLERPASIQEFLDSLTADPATAPAAACRDETPAVAPSAPPAPATPRPARASLLSDEVSALFPGCGGQEGSAKRDAASSVASAGHFLLRLVLCCAIALVPPACGVALAQRFFAHSMELAFLSIFAGWALAGVSLWLLVRYRSKAQQRTTGPSGRESR